MILLALQYYNQNYRVQRNVWYVLKVESVEVDTVERTLKSNELETNREHELDRICHLLT